MWRKYRRVQRLAVKLITDGPPWCFGGICNLKKRKENCVNGVEDRESD